MQSSKSVANSFLNQFIQFWDIAIFNNYVYVPAYDTLYVFSKDLYLVKAIKTRRTDKYIESVDNDMLLIDIMVEHQMENFSIITEYLAIDKQGTMSNVEKKVSIEDYKTDMKVNKVQGKRYNVLARNGKYYFQCDYGVIEMKGPIPDLIKYYATRNVNFNETTLAYFDSTPTTFTLYIYKW